ncbi:MAG: hypothetical protein HeimAB125_18010 [Candidatus Heimdallarchaeota archaeon AB_125]|nr:MAG: hypothetical protein HeimAB125_18010 [Candidatus Heimdallarchaeota archaeon AB_125]
MKLFLWHGEDDTLSPFSATEELSLKIPTAITKIFPDEGHYSVAVNNADEILGTVMKNL